MPSWKKVIVSGSDAFLNALTVTNGITGSLHGTASWAQNAITASYVLNAVSASYALNADLLDGRDSSVFATTGSNIFRGNQTVTGSLFTTGSNTLIGSTSLTGSLNISGSEIITGYIQFEPVTTNINPAISASYIYVSGSTSDLYFSQNGEGYSNTTRLRWLEGNLYTGLLNGGLITTQSSTVYQISSGSGIIVDLNASLNDNPYPTIQYLNWGNLSASIAPLTSSYQQAFVSIDSAGNIYQQGTPYVSGQFNTEINIGVVLFQNQSTINGVKTQPSLAYGFEQNQNIFNRAFGPLKLSGYTLAPSGSSTGSLIVASGTAYSPGSNYPVDPNNPSYAQDSGTNVSKIFRYHQSGSTWVYNTNAGAGFTSIDPTQYSNNGVLTAVPGGGSNRQWSIQRVFWFPNSVAKAIVVYYGNATYTTEIDAIANISFESFVEAPNTAANAIYLGAIVVRNDAVFTNSATYKIQPGGLFRQVGGSGGGGSTLTQTLAGLSDVNISGPTDGQALVYNTTQAKWINSSAISASITGNAATATSASFATSASYAENGGVTQIIAGANITVSPTNGLGQVTITSTGGGGGGGFNTATGSYGSFFDTTTQTASLANTGYPMRFNTTDVTNGVSISGSSNNFIKIANAGVYDLQFSAQLARSAGSGTEDTFIWLRKNGTDLSWTNTDVTFAGGSNVRQVAAWNWFLNAAAGDAYEIVWSTTSTNIIIEASTTPNPDVPSVIATVARIDQFLSNTGSFSGSFTGEFTGSLQGTASFAINATSASFATTASYVLNAISASFATSSSQSQNAVTASYVLNAVSASFASTASYVLNAVSSSFATSSSFSTNAASASYTLTASILQNNSAKVSSSTAIYTSGSSLLYNLSEFKGAMVDYVVSTSGSGASTRAGTFTAVWNSVFSSYNESTTMDIGNTDAVHFSADSTGSIFVNITSGSWVVDSLYRALGTSITSIPSPTTTITVKFYSVGTDPSLVGLTCASPTPHSVQIFGDPGNASPTFCGSDELLAIDITNILESGQSIPVGSIFYLSSGGQVRTWIRPFDSNLAYWYLDSCTSCPSTPTPTPTPTSTPTPSPTPTISLTPTVTPSPTPTPSSLLYYTLNPCTGGDPLYDTTITPLLADQRYTDPSSGGRFWTWDNAAGTSSPQQTVRASMQIVSGQSSCPP
jgi:energy-coupling factor transporter ATP-binding protein EcfA2